MGSDVAFVDVDAYVAVTFKAGFTFTFVVTFLVVAEGVLTAKVGPKVALIDVITDGTIAAVTGWTFTVVGSVSVDASGN